MKAFTNLLIIAATFPISSTVCMSQHRGGTQSTGGDWARQESHTAIEFGPASTLFGYPYAGKLESRIGGSWQPHADRLRLDIGCSVDLIRLSDSALDWSRERPFVLRNQFTIGTDFFTWTRLRSAENFKFPVEAVDYYFGLNGSWKFNNQKEFERFIPVDFARLRIAHISAHLVDGDPSFADTATRYKTFSREFVDGLLGTDLLSFAPPNRNPVTIRTYLGALWLFHTIPDTLGVITPYGGADASWAPFRGGALVLRMGYEFRYNTELAPVAEHLFRAGAKLGKENSTGLELQLGYYSGRSPYGQRFSEMESGWSIGFAVDY